MDIRSDGPTLVLRGDFDVRFTGEVRAALYDHLAAYPATDIVVDLSEVRSTDLTALRVLAAATRQARRHQQRIVLRGCCPPVLRLLHLSHLIRVVQVERGVPQVVPV